MLKLNAKKQKKGDNMKQEEKNIIVITLITIFIFNLFPTIAKFYPSVMSIYIVFLGLIAINSAYCFLICMVYSLKEGYKWYLPFLTGLLFIPTMFIFYDISSIVYIALYIFVGCVGNLIGGLISDYIHKTKA